MVSEGEAHALLTLLVHSHEQSGNLQPTCVRCMLKCPVTLRNGILNYAKNVHSWPYKTVNNKSSQMTLLCYIIIIIIIFNPEAEICAVVRGVTGKSGCCPCKDSH